jgi:hypothetical protein
MAELLLPEGEYSVTTSSHRGCQHAATIVTRPLSEFQKNIESAAQLHAINLKKEIALRKAIIRAGLHQFIDVGHLQLIFADRFGDVAHSTAALRRACQYVQNGFGGQWGDDDLNYLIIDRYKLILAYAVRILSEYYSEQGDNFKIPSDYRFIQKPGSFWPNFGEACKRIPEMVTALQTITSRPSIYVYLRMQNIDENIVTESHISEQAIIAKLNMLIRRLFGYEVSKVIMKYNQDRCQMSVEDGVVGRGHCVTKGHAGAPLHYTDKPIENTLSHKVEGAKIDRNAVETVLRSIFGENATLEFLVDSNSLFLAKVSGARRLIVKAEGYWELIYVSVIPSDDYVHVVIEASYTTGLGSKPPP